MPPAARPLKILSMQDKKDNSAKEALRKKFLRLRADYPAAQKHAMGIRAQNRLMASREWREASTVGMYMALDNEMPTDALLANALQNGKNVWLPKVVDGKHGLMKFLPYTGGTPLKRGFFHILEPEENGLAPAFQPDLLVAPGLAFDLQGRRLGFGGGFYDRFLDNPNFFCPRVCGLAFSFQIVSHLPEEPWDMRVNGLCSEDELLWL